MDFLKYLTWKFCFFFLSCKIEKLISIWNHFTVFPSFFFPQAKNIAFTYKTKQKVLAMDKDSSLLM